MTTLQEEDRMPSIDQRKPIAMPPADEAARDVDAPITVRVLTSDEELDSIRAAWMRLSAHPHADPDFFKMVLRTSPGVKSGYVLAVERSGQITALLLGRVETLNLEMRLGYARLPQPTARALVFIYGGLLGLPAASECRAIANSISGALKKGVADVAFFNHLRTDSPLYPLLIENAGPLTRDRFTTASAHRKITIPSGIDAFWKQLTYKARGNFRWNLKSSLKAHGNNYTIECITEPERLDELVGKVEPIAAKTYQRSLGVGFGASAAEMDRLRLKAEKGWLRAYVLSINGTPSAFFFGTVYRNTLHADYMGFDPELRRTSPGIFLTINVIERFCALTGDNRVESIDFGLGDARYKADLCNEEWEDGAVYLFAPTLSGVVLNMYRTPVLFLDRLARRIFNASLQEKIKSKWRARRSGKAGAPQSKAEQE